jgi:hypothetical protein
MLLQEHDVGSAISDSYGSTVGGLHLQKEGQPKSAFSDNNTCEDEAACC